MLPFSRLPTNNTILQRLHFDISASCNGNSILHLAALTVKNKLVELWGYADILQQSSCIVREIKLLNTDLKSLSKITVSRRTSPSFLEKEAGFLATLPKLFNITVESLRYTQLITSGDRDFLLNNWWKHISSTPDLAAQKAVNIKFQ